MQKIGWWKPLVRVGITVVLLTIILFRIDFETLGSLLHHSKWYYLVPALLVHGIALFIGLLRWSRLLRNFGVSSPLRRLVKIQLIGMFSNLFLPSAFGGDVVKSFYLSKQGKIPVSSTLSAAALDRVAGFSALILIGLVASTANSFKLGTTPVSLVFLILAATFTIWIVVAYLPTARSMIARLFARIGLGRLNESVAVLWAGLDRLKRDRFGGVAILALSIVMQLLAITAVWIASYSLDIEVPFAVFLLFVPLIYLSVAIPVTVNGIGMRESAYLLLFTEIGVQPEAAVLLALINFMMAVIPSLLGGGLLLMDRGYGSER